MAEMARKSGDVEGEVDIDHLQDQVLEEIGSAGALDVLEQIRVAELGKKGRITTLTKSLGTLAPEARREAGQRYNLLKQAIAEAIANRRETLEASALDTQLLKETVDVTLPTRPEALGRLHPVSQVTEELIAIFGEMGFRVAEGPDVEDDFNNFSALNIPPEHPARQMQDTFYLEAEKDGVPLVLRTHTSPVQIRTMMEGPPPYRIIAPGRTYRCDYDLTHTPMFHQVEGLVIEKGIHMGHLKGCLVDFVKAFFEVDTVEARMRPHFFPFTEPSAEMDVKYTRKGDTIQIGAGDSWMEILGSGMVHPNVLRNCGIDPDEYQGFAFGMGIDRLAMLKYGMPDLRPYFEADPEWTTHYGFRPWLTPSVSGGLS